MAELLSLEDCNSPQPEQLFPSLAITLRFDMGLVSWRRFGLEWVLLSASASHLAFARTNVHERFARAFSTLFVICAVFLQSYVVQTHIHGLPGSPSSTVEAGKVAAPQAPASGPSDKKHGPAQNDPDDCPLCQAAFHANAIFFDAPAAVAPSILFFKPAIGIFEQDFPALYRGHDQEQRGPPRL